MKCEYSLFREQIVCNSKYSFLHFSSILCAQYDHFSISQIYSNTSFWCYTINVFLNCLWPCIKNIKIDIPTEILLEFLFCWSDQHIFHEQCMIWSCTKYSNSQSIIDIPSCITIYNEQLSIVYILYFISSTQIF